MVLNEEKSKSEVSWSKLNSKSLTLILYILGGEPSRDQHPLLIFTATSRRER